MHCVIVDVSERVVLLSRHKIDVKEDIRSTNNISIWYPELNSGPSVLKNNFHLFSNYPKL